MIEELAVQPPKPTCPECRAGKCQNCDTTATDPATLEPTFCACWAENRSNWHAD